VSRFADARLAAAPVALCEVHLSCWVCGRTFRLAANRSDRYHRLRLDRSIYTTLRLAGTQFDVYVDDVG
jgi:hypothetical protein